MAIQISSVGGRLDSKIGGRRRSRSRRLMSEINITPFVDVMLVLLIIFMVTAPLLTSGIKVDLPETAATPIESEDEPISVTITKDGTIYLQKTKVSADELALKLKAIIGANPSMRIFVHGDKKINYGNIMQIVSLINQAGFKRIALVTEDIGKAGK